MRVLLLTWAALLLGTATARSQVPAPAEEVAPKKAASAVAPAPELQAPPAPTESGSPDLAPALAARSIADDLTVGLSEQELRELGFAADAPALDTSVKLSGFIDFGTNVGLDEATRTGTTGRQAFYIGNLNLYISKALTENVRTMAEVRFTYLPNGAPKSLLEPARTSTAAADYSDFNRPLRWGGVEIERVYLDWAVHQYLTLRLGQFLTPYGIWNVDHGSPTIIPVSRPFVIGASYFPERQTGFELFGRWEATGVSTLGYHLTLSNGTGPAAEYKEIDMNKAVGGRFYWENRRVGEFRLGSSLYYGRDTDGVPTATIVGTERRVTEKLTTQADTLALGLDVQWKYRGLHIQSELLTRQVRYTTEGRVSAFTLSAGMPKYPADYTSLGGYLLLGYRFDWWGTMPYVVFQRIKEGDPLLGSGTGVTPYSVGLNIRPVEAVAVKLEYQHVKFDSDNLFLNDKFRMVGLQVAWAF